MKTARKSPSEQFRIRAQPGEQRRGDPRPAPDRADVEAVVLSRNDPVRLNACLWSLFNQTIRPASVLIVNTGAWLTSEIGGSIDIISEQMQVSVRRVRNRRLGDVHADCLLLAQRKWVWFFQDDAVAAPRCLEKLLLSLSNGEVGPRLPTVVYPDYEAMAGEAEELPQESAYTERDEPKSYRPRRGPCLGLLLERGLAQEIAPVIAGMPMGLDDVLVQLSQPLLVASEGAVVFHTRPEKPRWNRIIDLMKKEVLPRRSLK